MELYYSPGACSMAVHIVLSELGLKYNLHKLNLKEGDQKKPEYLKVNPKGYVPAIKTDSGDVITEASVIMQYLADQKPEKHLVPTPGSMERVRLMEWMNFITAEMHKGLGAYFSLGQYKNPETVKDVRTFGDAKLKTRFDYLASHLSKNQFLMGDKFSVADAYLFTILGWTKILDVDLSPWPALLGYMERLSSRPSVQAAMAEEGLTGAKG